jgi:uncharacterized membrane protein YeiH
MTHLGVEGLTMPREAIPALLPALDLLGVFANAILGGGIARQHRLDPIGFAALAIFSGLGGGILRDVLLQQGPPVALTDEAYLPTALGGAAVAFALRWESKNVKLLGTLIDALALGGWAAVGSQKTLLFGFGWLPAVLLGTVTAVGGGVMRDVIVGRIPTIFGGNTLYATCAIIAGGVTVIMEYIGLGQWGPIVATFAGAALVLLARWRGWMLPMEVEWRRPAEYLPHLPHRRKEN